MLIVVLYINYNYHLYQPFLFFIKAIILSILVIPEIQSSKTKI